MFLDDIRLVTEMIGKYGLRKPMVDLGGLPRPTIADYDITIRTGDQNARYITLPHRPFDLIDPEYKIFNPEMGDPIIENLPAKHFGKFGTIVCLNVIEHTKEPQKVFEAFRDLLQPKGLLIVSTVFSFPYHPSPHDYLRYTPEYLKWVTTSVGLEVLEADWRLKILADAGVKEIHTGEPQEIKSVYVAARKH